MKNTVKELYELKVTKVVEFPSDYSEDEKLVTVARMFEDLLTDSSVSDGEMIAVSKVVGVKTAFDLIDEEPKEESTNQCNCETTCENCDCE